MERSEPTLVPQWLRSAGSVYVGGSLAHQFASSSSRSDSSSLLHHTRNRDSRSRNDTDTNRSLFLDRSSSTDSRWRSCNGFAKHAYSSFSRNHRHRDHDREKDRLSYVDQLDHESSDPLGSILTTRGEGQLRRSHSIVPRKPGGPLPQGASIGLKNSVNSNQHSGNCVLPGHTIGNSFQKNVSEKDFPSLGSEEKHGVPDVSGVLSPVLSSAVQSLPVGNLALIGGDGWTSALAEVPNVTEKNSSGSLSSPQPGPNMAETLVQTPPQTHNPPQLSVKTQRLEERAIKQSRQLIPVTPSNKGSVLNYFDKFKIKPTQPHAACRSLQQQPSTLPNSNQSHLVGQMKPDSPKKLFVLKPSWENGVSAVPRDGPIDNVNGRATDNQLTVAPPAESSPARSRNGPKDRKVASLISRALEKKPLSQTQSRNEFFNLLKQKASTKPLGSSSSLSSSSDEEDKLSKGVVSDRSSPQVVVSDAVVRNQDEVCAGVQKFFQVGEKNKSSEAAVSPDEEEAAFLRSLGWEESTGEDEGLTEEEISGFLEQYKQLMPTMKSSLGILPKLSAMQENEASSNLSSSDP